MHALRHPARRTRGRERLVLLRGGHHADVMTGIRCDITKMDIESVGEEHSGIGLEIRLDVIGPDRSLRLIRGEDHDDIRFANRVAYFRHLKTLLFSLVNRF